jgi:hypothetical protein
MGGRAWVDWWLDHFRGVTNMVRSGGRGGIAALNGALFEAAEDAALAGGAEVLDVLVGEIDFAGCGVETDYVGRGKEFEFGDNHGEQLGTEFLVGVIREFDAKVGFDGADEVGGVLLFLGDGFGGHGGGGFE